jgi:antitoxin CptB
MNDSESRIKRVLYRACHRGTKEMDFMLGRFAEAEAQTLPEAEFAILETMLTMPDQPIQSWLSGEETPSEFRSVIGRIRRFHGVAELDKAQ